MSVFTREQVARLKAIEKIWLEQGKGGLRDLFSAIIQRLDPENKTAGMSAEEVEKILQEFLGNSEETATSTEAVVLTPEPTPKQSNLYADEEKPSNYTYPEEYKGPKPIADQIETIASIFGLDPTKALEYAENLPALPEGAEGWFAIPSVDALSAKHFPKVTDPAEKYCRAVQLVHAKIAASRSFYNYREGQITPAQLRVHARTAHALDLIAETQKGDILIVAAQLGMRHRGKSVRRAREVFVANEFGLGSLAIGSIVLTHPERLFRFEELEMYCPGDEFSGAGGGFSFAPFFGFHDGGVRFGADWYVIALDYFGSASAFLSPTH